MGLFLLFLSFVNHVIVSISDELPPARTIKCVYILFSCRTVEVNNTDAEGRLVLGDGVRSAFVFLIFSGLLWLLKRAQSP